MFGVQQKNRLTRIFTTATVVISIFNANAYYKKKDGLIYILIWTPIDTKFIYLPGMGQEAFKNCSFNNCFLTEDRNYLKKVDNYEVIIFNVVDLEVNKNLPTNRSLVQKYCLYGLEPAMTYPIHKEFNGFFNITFTYKLSSNIALPYVIIRDDYNEVIGPNINMQWRDLGKSHLVSEFIRTKVESKHIAAAWIVSSCESVAHGTSLYAQNLQIELERFGHRLDIYGRCGTTCPKGEFGRCGNTQCPAYETMDECLALIESDYYFYLSFESSSGEDYVTDKLLWGLQHFSVPVVFGNANYSRFMPDGVYLDANVLAPADMATKINKIINDNGKYYEFFKWQDYYSFHYAGDDQSGRVVCKLCEFLNNNQNETSILENITKWWNEPMPTTS